MNTHHIGMPGSGYDGPTLVQVINFVSEQNPDLCLSIENQASCQSSQSPGSSTIINPLSQVCVWNNALLQTCWSGGSDAANDQSWIYDNQTKLIAYSDVNMNACLEICTTETFARGSCSLIDNNISEPAFFSNTLLEGLFPLADHACGCSTISESRDVDA